MADQTYNVRLDRTAGTIEISGPDKAWISDQLDKLTKVLVEPATAQSAPKRQAARGKPAHKEETPPEGTSRRRRSGSGNRAKRNSEMEGRLTSTVKGQLQRWRDERQGHFTSLSKQAAIIATFLLDTLKVEEVGPDEMYTIYTVMGWDVPGNPKVQLENARARDNYFGSWASGKVRLSHTGEQFGRNAAKSEPKPKGKAK